VEENREIERTELMKTEIALYDQNLAEASAASALCLGRASSLKLDPGRAAEKPQNPTNEPLKGEIA
jgi:hypothetical protein